ncbi:LtfC-like domain-containing protein [Nocardia jiangxiensis]
MASSVVNQMTLGNEPQNLRVVMSPNAVWNPTITAQDKNGNPVPWPAGTTCQIIFTDSPPDSAYTVTFPATVSGANLSWALTVAQVNVIPDGCLVQVYLDQSGNGTAPMLWMSGTLQVRS